MKPTALLALGFRPFYLLAGAFAAFAVGYQAAQYKGWVPLVEPLWHAHEMVFGFAFAVIAGFLFTAVRNWTDRDTPTGGALAAIAGVWIAARVAALFSLAAAGVLDALFAICVAWGIGRPLWASGNRRNLFMVVLVLLLGGASAVFQLYPAPALRLGLDVILFVMTVIAGRVIPMFTNNTIAGAGATSHAWLEKASAASVALLLVSDLASLETAGSLVALAAAGLHAVRLALWAPHKTFGKPILWILHLSYAWIVVHLALRGLAGFGLVPATLATHALTAGAIGGLTLGMMTRTARGHTGRPLVAGPTEVAAYVFVVAAAIVRVFVPLLLPSVYLAAISVAAVFWVAAFALFVVAYFPILTQARADGRPG